MQIDPPLTAPFENVVRERRSVHRFEPGQRISKAQWRKLFELSALSPSSWNFQPWDFVVVEDDDRRRELRPLCWNQSQIVDSAAVIAVIGDKNPHRRDEEIFAQFLENGYIDDATLQAYRGAVDVVYHDDARRIEHAVGGACLAAMTLMLTAQAMGLGTLPIIGFDPSGVRKFFNVTGDYMVAMLIAIGPAKGGELPRQQRRPFEDIVHWDRFGNL
ncbi:MAG: nitroreductase family protein [Magnetospirillum sp.]|nr:nitroreductase family protein [Magnetospirillum sp.]